MTGFYENYDDAEGVHKGSAEQSALEAAASATAAASSATSAETSATSSSTKAGEAATSASTATTKASEAATSASTATTKASESATSASASDTSATESATSATASESSRQASASAAAVAVSAYGSAFNSATASAASATAAAGSESAVAASATAAAGSATTASTSASNAATSESNAATSATEAAASATLANSAEVVTVAGIAADVTAVAGIDGNVTSVAGIASDVTTVAAEPLKTNIATVAATPLSTNINIVGPAASSVTTVAGDIAKVNTVAADLSGSDTIGTVAGVASNVTTVSGIAADVTTVAGITAGDISLVAAIDDKVTQVAAINDQVAVVGSDPYKTKVETVAESVYKGKVETVSGLTSEVTSVANIASDVTTVSANITDIQNAEQNANTATTKAAESAASAVTSAASASTSASSAAASASSATAAASSESNAATSESDAAVSASSATVSAASAQSSKEAAAVSETNAAASYDSFDDRYLGVKSSAPSTDNDGGALLTGALYFNSTNNTMNVFTGSAWAPVANNNIINPNVALTQDLATNGNDIKFGDNDKAVFGAGDDLQIYHNGNNSFIADTGTGSLYIRAADSLRLQSYGTNADMIRAESEGAVSLFYDKATYSAAKLATTSTGIDVTGAATMDGLTVEGNGALFTLDNGSNAATLSNTNGNVVLNYDAADAGRAFTVQQNGRNVLRANNSGDVSFYEDTGTTAKLTWDASAESLGIGTSSPSAGIDVVKTGSVTVGNFETDGNSTVTIKRTGASATTSSIIASSGGKTTLASSGYTTFETSGTERLRIDSSGRVGIGTNSIVDSQLHLKTESSTNLRIEGGDANSKNIVFVKNTGGTQQAKISAVGESLYFTTGTTERLRIDSSGRVGIGETGMSAYDSDADDLVVKTGGNTGITVRTSSTGTGSIFFSDGTSGAERYQGTIRYFHNGNAMTFGTGAAERMRIDSSGNLLVGKTSASSATVGFQAGQGGFIAATRASAQPLVLNRTTNDGTIADFRKDGTTVGSIGAQGGANLLIGNGDTGIRFAASNNAIHPWNTSTLGPRDAAIDLGADSIRFKDLYLSGSVKTGSGLDLTDGTSIFGSIAVSSSSLALNARNTGVMLFQSGGAEKARIDAAGNWMLGTTNSNVYTSSTENGLYVTSTGQIRNSVGAVAAYLNRTGSDGAIQEFRKDGTTVGSIRSDTNRLVIDAPNNGSALILEGSNTSGTTTRLAMNNAGGSEAFRPFNADSDALFDLGSSTRRFKDLHLSGTAKVGGNIVSSANNFIYSHNGGTSTGTVRSGFKLEGSSNTLAFYTNALEKARIDSSGNLLVGKTGLDVGVVGQELRSSGYMAATRDGSTVGSYTRLSSDGTILEFRKDGTAVGSIGVKDGYLTAGNADAGLLFLGSGVKRIQPWSVSSNSGADNQIDLGYSTERFKDLHLSGTIHKSTGTGTFKVETSGSSSVNLEASNTLKFTVGDSDSHQFINGSSEVARIDSSGYLLVGTTSSANGGHVLKIASGTVSTFETGATTSTNMIVFRNGNGNVGTINTNGTTTSYNTSSDQRLKENIADADDAGSKIDAIQVRKYDWKADGSHQDYGMIAQELVEVAPEAVTVPEDSEEMMGVDYSKLVPMLIKEIQSLRNRVAQLETGE